MKLKNKANNISILKKIYFSVCKIKKYGELAKLGYKKSRNYIMDIILICSIIYSSILVFQIKNNASELNAYLQENFPNISYQDNTLISDIGERTVLNHDLVKANFGGQIIIDTKSEYETLIDEYKNTGESAILLTKEKYVTINSLGDIAEYNYEEIINQVEEQGEVSINKEYFVNLFSNISYTYYFFVYFLGMSIATTILIFGYNLLISVMAFIVCKIKKINIKFSEIYSIGLYAHTLSVLGYFIMNFMPYSISAYLQVIILLIPIIYLTYAIHINKWLMPETK